MRPYSRLIIVAGALFVRGTAAAQTTARTPELPYERGCHGNAIQMRIDGFTKLPTAYPLVTEVEAGSPAALAGLQVGDSLVSQSGVEFTDGVPPQRYAVGDTIRLVVRRGGRNHPVVLVLGRATVSADGSSGSRVCRPAPRGK